MIQRARVYPPRCRRYPVICRLFLLPSLRLTEGLCTSTTGTDNMLSWEDPCDKRTEQSLEDELDLWDTWKYIRDGEPIRKPSQRLRVEGIELPSPSRESMQEKIHRENDSFKETMNSCCAVVPDSALGSETLSRIVQEQTIRAQHSIICCLRSIIVEKEKTIAQHATTITAQKATIDQYQRAAEAPQPTIMDRNKTTETRKRRLESSRSSTRETEAMVSNNEKRTYLKHRNTKVIRRTRKTVLAESRSGLGTSQLTPTRKGC